MAAAVQPSAAAAAAIDDGHHPHRLFLRTKRRLFKCDRCKCDGFGRRYICRDCKVCFHELCATCPEWIQFFMHPDHILALQRSYNPFARHKCEACGNPAHGYFYRCKPCSFELHPFCSLLQPTITDEAHPGHMLGYANGEKTPCMVCGEECVGWRYICQECPAHVHMKCLGVFGSGGHGSAEEGTKKEIMGKKAKAASKTIGGFGAMLAVILSTAATVAAAAGEEADVDFDFGGFEMEGADDFEFDFKFDFEAEEEVELELELEATAGVEAEFVVTAEVEAEVEAENEDEDSSDDSDEGGKEDGDKDANNEKAKEKKKENNKKKSRNPFKPFLNVSGRGDKEEKDKNNDNKEKKKKKNKEEDK